MPVYLGASRVGGACRQLQVADLQPAQLRRPQPRVREEQRHQLVHRVPLPDDRRDGGDLCGGERVVLEGFAVPDAGPVELDPISGVRRNRIVPHRVLQHPVQLRPRVLHRLRLRPRPTNSRSSASHMRGVTCATGVAPSEYCRVVAREVSGRVPLVDLPVPRDAGALSTYVESSRRYSARVSSPPT